MTSNPASRSARATTFAPRSWPSRPGLATTTRMGTGHGSWWDVDRDGLEGSAGPDPRGHLGAGPTGGVRGRRRRARALASPPRDARPPACPTDLPPLRPAARRRGARAGARTAAPTSGWAPGHCSPGWCRTPRTSTCPLAGPTRWAGPTTTTCATPPRRRPAPTSPWSVVRGHVGDAAAVVRRAGSSRSSAGRWDRSPGQRIAAAYDAARDAGPAGGAAAVHRRRAHAGGHGLAGADGRDHGRRDPARRRGPAAGHRPARPDHGRRVRLARQPRRRGAGPNPARPSGSPVPAWPRR